MESSNDNRINNSFEIEKSDEINLDIDEHGDVNIDHSRKLGSQNSSELQLFVSSQKFISNCCTTAHICTWFLLFSKTLTMILWVNMIVKMYGPMFIAYPFAAIPTFYSAFNLAFLCCYPLFYPIDPFIKSLITRRFTWIIVFLILVLLVGDFISLLIRLKKVKKIKEIFCFYYLLIYQ